MRLSALFIFFIALTGCQTSEKLAKCKGSPFGLNGGHWQPTRQDLKGCKPNSPGQDR